VLVQVEELENAIDAPRKGEVLGDKTRHRTKQEPRVFIVGRMLITQMALQSWPRKLSPTESATINPSCPREGRDSVPTLPDKNLLKCTPRGTAR
jgi:hypothetical protein